MNKEILYIREGLELRPDPNNPKKKLVTWTDLHEEGLDTSLKTNPICNCGKFEFNGHKIPVISTFKRKASKYVDGDGNPALYALKKERNFELTNQQAFLKRFNLILDKLVQTLDDILVLLPDHYFHWHPDTLIPLPSTNPLNTYITKSVASKFKNVNVVDNALRKLTYQEVLDCISDDENGTYFDFWNALADNNIPVEDARNIIQDLHNEFKKADPTLQGTFKRHAIKNLKLRNAITHTMSMSMSYYEEINGKNIVLLDDSITFGASIKETLELLYTMYEPKSVIVITMFSEKYKQ